MKPICYVCELPMEQRGDAPDHFICVNCDRAYRESQLMLKTTIEQREALSEDAKRMDWLERNLMHIGHDRATCSVDMAGRCVRGQLVNEARGSGGGSSYFTVSHKSIREAVDAAMQWKKP